MQNINVLGELVLTLKSKEAWVSKVPKCLPQNRRQGELLFLDKNGNVLLSGADFSAAERLETYPVSVYKLQHVSEKEQTLLNTVA